MILDAGNWDGVFISKGCWNTLAQAGGLKTTEAHSLAILEARSPKSRCWQDHALSEGSVGESFLASPALQEVAGHPQHSLACNRITSTSMSLATWRSSRVSSFLMRTPVLLD